MTLSYLAYQTVAKFENYGFDVWFRNNEDHIANTIDVQIEIVDKKFADDTWGYEIQLYSVMHGSQPFFKERMTEDNDADYYFAMINKVLDEKGL